MIDVDVSKLGARLLRKWKQEQTGGYRNSGAASAFLERIQHSPKIDRDSEIDRLPEMTQEQAGGDRNGSRNKPLLSRNRPIVRPTPEITQEGGDRNGGAASAFLERTLRELGAEPEVARGGSSESSRYTIEVYIKL